MKPFLQCSWTFDTEAWAFSISTGNFHFVRASVPERLALPASNVAVGSVFNLDFPILYVLHGNKELTLSFYRTQVYLGSDLWVQVSVTHSLTQ